MSTGGPATTVTWTRDSVTVTEGTETALDDPVTAQYTHTLTVTDIREGVYICTVSNCKPSKDSAIFHAPGKNLVSIIIKTIIYVTVNYVSSSPVEQFELTESSSSFLAFSWTPPSVVTAFVPGFNLTCEPLLEGIPPPENRPTSLWLQ